MSGPAYAPEWLELREDADAAARSADLAGLLRPYLSGATTGATTVVRDLGCGTGSMGRWLTGRLPAPQRWILHDRDPELLAIAARSFDGATTVTGDATALTPADLDGTSLVTASALLDLLTAREVARLAEVCAEARCPALLALSVTGSVELTPYDPLDAEIAAAFDDHQRRTVGGRRLLGPEAAGITASAFARTGAAVHRRPSPWRLGPDQAALTARWLRDRVAAAVEQRPELAPRTDAYLRRRLASCAAGELRAVVGHVDLLAIPAGVS